jgi:hypothetical protein
MRAVITLLAFSLLLPASASAQQSDSAAVMATIERFTAGLRTKDTFAMKAELHQHARMTLLRPAPSGGIQVHVFDGPAFIKLATNGPALDEPIRNPRVTIDADLATVWAEYQVRINGTVSHCGYDAFHLVKMSGSWKLLNISDTFRPDGCGEKW